MSGIILRLLCLGFFLSLSLGKGYAQITVTADEEDAFYEAGETMNFEVSANYNASVTYEIFYDKFTTPLASGNLSLSSGQTSYIPFTLNEPGVVFCVVTQGGTKETAVAAFSPYDIEQLEPEPADFDAFWNSKKAELASVSMDPNLTYYSGNSYSTTYKIDLAQIDGRRVYGYISIPQGAGPFPAILELPAYGSGANTISPDDFIAERGGAISMRISIHNGPLNQGDPDAYEPDEIDDSNNIYIRYGVLAALRSIDYIFTRSDFDGEHMGVVGVSQGGALSMMVAGIDDRVNLLAYAHPAYCEHAGLPNDKASGFPFYVQRSRNTDGSTAHELATIAATRYYDAINFMKRYDGPSLGFIGYQDEISLASGIFAAYNGLTGPSILLHEIEIGHNPMPGEYWNGRYDFFRRHFPAMANPPWPYPDETTGYGIDAGSDTSIPAGTTLNLSGEAYDNDNLNTSWPVQWEKVSGPGSVNFGNANSANTTATFSSQGTYVLRYSVTDYGLLNSISKYYRLSDQIEVEVGSGNSSSLTLNCPADINITLPVGSSNTSVNWNAPFPSGSCPGGGLSVSQTSGPSNGSSLSAGTYNVVYQATDNCGNNTTCNFTISIENNTTIPGNYCEASGDAPWFEWISAVNFGDINNYSVKEKYGDFTDQSTAVNTGESYPISITAAFSWQSDDVYVRAWIDYNNDYVFQESEEIACSATALVNGNGGATSTPLSGTVSIPSDAVVGSTRMRVALQRDVYADPCGTFSFGEVEDYTITINEGAISSFLTINCPQNISVTAPQGSDEAVVGWSAPTTFSSCPSGSVSLTQTQGLPSGAAFPEGNTGISYLATDACGNNETCSFIINVTLDDNLPPPSDEYCVSQGNTPWNEWISNVSLEQINNSSLKTTYADFTDEVATLEQGASVTLNVTGSFSWQSDDAYLRVWIDYNQDNIFQEPGEIVLSEIFEEGSGGATSALGTEAIDIPSNALVGNTRMRVALKRNGYADPCESFAFGEVEDYGINILPANNAVLSLTCPADIQVTIPLGENDIPVSWDAPNTATSCPGNIVNLSQTQGANSGSSFTEGTYEIVYQATDNCNNTEFCSFIITVTAQTTPEGYCNSQGNTPWTEWVRRVRLKETDNNSDKTQYSDFTNLVANVAQGETATLTVSSGYSWQSHDNYLRVWIDYNQDGVFQEPAEIVLSDIMYWGSGGATLVNSSADISIPSTAAAGQTRMRVALKRDAFADPCENFAFGEVEDYTINIAEQAVNYDLTLDCPQNTTFNIPQGSNVALVNWLIPQAETTCPNASIVLEQTGGPNAGSYLPEGTYEIIYSVTDACNNIEYCNYIVTVVDNNNGGPLEYCDADGEEPWAEYIWKVRFGAINNTSHKEGYGDFTDQSTVVNLGDQTQIRLQAKFSFEKWDEYFRVWIDWNQDGDFYDGGERVFSGILDGDFSGGNAPLVIGLIETPLYALTGETRMRISMRREAYADPCENFVYGEVEDYTVIVSDGNGLEGSTSEFLFMTAAKENGVSKLNWDCNTANRTRTFEVERSFDQIDFVKISETGVALNAATTSHYTALDTEPQSGKNFYRIKQIFNDGSVRYSAIRELEYPVFEKEISLFPNPAKDEIFVQLSAFAGESVVMELYNTLGLKMETINVDNCTTTPIRIDLTDFNNGIYIISVNQESGKRKSQWFVTEHLD